VDIVNAQGLADQLLKKIVIRAGGDEFKIYKALAPLLGYEAVPPTMEEFLNGDEFFGNRQLNLGKNIFPVWKDTLHLIYPNPFYSPYVEIVATGAIGIGKTTLAKVGASYDLARLLLMKNPQEYYHFTPTSRIVYALINATLTLSRGVIYDELLEWFTLSPFFRKQVAVAKRYKSLFPKNIDVAVGSRPSHFLGTEVFGAILDELNFQDKVKDQAWTNYSVIKSRITSRFKRGGRVPGHMWLLSSKARENSMLEEYIRREAYNASTTLVKDVSLWDAKGHLMRLSGEKFLVYLGDETRDPFIIGDEKDYSSIRHMNLDESRILEVPIEFKEDFVRDIYQSLQDIAGISVSSIYRFIPSVKIIKNSMQQPNPVKKTIIRLSFNDDDRIINYLELNTKDPQPRYIHFDIGVSHDRTGIASSYILGWKRVSRRNPVTGVELVTNEPIFRTEWVIYIEPHSGEEVPLYKLRNFILDLLVSGYPVGAVSADGYQSTQLRQELNRSITTELVSVDRKKDAYLEVKRALYESRLFLPDHDLLAKELRELMDTGKKIDHPPKGSKDGADAVAGSVYMASQNRSSILNSLQAMAGEDWVVGGGLDDDNYDDVLGLQI